ncbi:MAG: hypothetical protein KatS3mg024_1490 [Armatimonadota bacterium]|nr:MAG: hypothetical protein KatS3mg024_1490 [Armatimonadota bacterium]
MPAPVVNRIIPTHNRMDYVLEAVRSVVEQTYPAYEITVVSDGCTDGTEEALRERFPSAQVFATASCGETAARKRGVAEATGEWLALLNSDDLWHSAKLERIAHFLDNKPDVEAVCHPNFYFSEPGGPADHGCIRRHFEAVTLEECVYAAQERNLEVEQAGTPRLGAAHSEMLLFSAVGNRSSAGILDNFHEACVFEVLPVLPYPSPGIPEATALGAVFGDFAYRAIAPSPVGATGTQVERNEHCA